MGLREYSALGHKATVHSSKYTKKKSVLINDKNKTPLEYEMAVRSGGGWVGG
jgi:hypothetical protein